jgi:hypothetical protein
VPATHHAATVPAKKQLSHQTETLFLSNKPPWQLIEHNCRSLSFDFGLLKQMGVHFSKNLSGHFYLCFSLRY